VDGGDRGAQGGGVGAEFVARDDGRGLDKRPGEEPTGEGDSGDAGAFVVSTVWSIGVWAGAAWSIEV